MYLSEFGPLAIGLLSLYEIFCPATILECLALLRRRLRWSLYDGSLSFVRCLSFKISNRHVSAARRQISTESYLEHAFDGGKDCIGFKANRSKLALWLTWQPDSNALFK